MSSRTIKNPYLPQVYTLEKVTIENDEKDLKTFRLAAGGNGHGFRHRCGQFAMLSVPGAGECPIGIASSPMDEGYLEFTVKRYQYGLVTPALHNLRAGAYIGVRGPFGNAFPLEEMQGKNVIIVGGGFAFTTLRAAIRYLLHEVNRPHYNTLTVLYGARNPGELLYKAELAAWKQREDLKLQITVDTAEKGWTGNKGFVPVILREIAPRPENAVVLLCGPPLMLKFTIPVLTELGFNGEQIITSLERKMSCGIGKCGKCNIESKYVCKDGPVFSYNQLQSLSAE